MVAVGAAHGQFEGVLEMKMSMTNKAGASEGNGTMTVLIGKPGARSEMNMEVEGMTMKMVLLSRNAEPNTLYRINDASRTYSVMDVSETPEKVSRASEKDKKHIVKKLGEEKVAGYTTQHVLVSREGETGTDELWTAKDFLDYARFSKFYARPGSRERNAEALNRALKAAGAEGMPLKAVITSEDGGKVVMEVVKAEKKALPASTFEVPEGYQKSEGMMDMMGGMSGPKADEARKEMEEALKNLPPEQREMIEKMMKQRGGKP
jgi:hypothetical protein